MSPMKIISVLLLILLAYPVSHLRTRSYKRAIIRRSLHSLVNMLRLSNDVITDNLVAIMWRGFPDGIELNGKFIFLSYIILAILFRGFN